MLYCIFSSGILLKDPMLGAFPAAWKKRFSFSPTLPKTPVLPFRPPLREADSLTLYPSLLISPSQGLSRSLHPEGQEALQSKDNPYSTTHTVYYLIHSILVSMYLIHRCISCLMNNVLFKTFRQLGKICLESNVHITDSVKLQTRQCCCNAD